MGVSDGSLTNAAVEWMRRVYEQANVIEPPPTSAPVTEDFRYIDRRTGGSNYGSLDASGWQKLVTETWRVGSGRPTFAVVDVVAVRGEWSAAVVELTDFGDDTSMEFITCFQLDAEYRGHDRRFVAARWARRSRPLGG